MRNKVAAEEERASHHKRGFFIIKGNGQFRTSWDIFIVFLSLWNCFTLPVEIAFQPAAFTFLGFKIFDFLIDSAFGVDIVLNFRTTIINDIVTEETIDPKKIARSYLKGRFIIDLLATLPFEDIITAATASEKGGVSHNFALLSMLKIFRILRFTKIISYLNATENVKLSLKLFKMVFYLCIYIHWQACAWYFYT